MTARGVPVNHTLPISFKSGMADEVSAPASTNDRTILGEEYDRQLTILVITGR